MNHCRFFTRTTKSPRHPCCYRNMQMFSPGTWISSEEQWGSLAKLQKIDIWCGIEQEILLWEQYACFWAGYYSGNNMHVFGWGWGDKTHVSKVSWTAVYILVSKMHDIKTGSFSTSPFEGYEEGHMIRRYWTYDQKVLCMFVFLSSWSWAAS